MDDVKFSASDYVNLNQESIETNYILSSITLGSGYIYDYFKGAMVK